jgi:hypothetical protein
MLINISSSSTLASDDKTILIEGDCEILISIGEASEEVTKRSLDILCEPLKEKVEYSVAIGGKVAGYEVMEMSHAQSLNLRRDDQVLLKFRGIKSLRLPFPDCYESTKIRECRSFIWVMKSGSPYTTPCYSGCF